MNHIQDLGELRNTYYILRHGKSEANEQALIISSPDDGVPRYGLAEAGRRHVAAAVEAAIRDHILDDTILIVSSDFLRARQTAEIAARLLAAREIILTPLLRERFFGAWDRQHNRSYQHVWDDDAIDPAHKHQGVESTVEVLSRTTALVKELEQTYAGRKILLVSHGDALQILQTAFERVPPSQHRRLVHLETGEIRELRLKPADEAAPEP